MTITVSPAGSAGDNADNDSLVEEENYGSAQEIANQRFFLAEGDYRILTTTNLTEPFTIGEITKTLSNWDNIMIGLTNPKNAIGRQFGEGFITGDVMTSACMYLTVVAETAFTNTLFVAMPSEAARNGDHALPTVFLSVQSDEKPPYRQRHSLLMAALKEPENHLLLERDLRYAFRQNHAIVDAAIGTLIEYGTTNRDKEKESLCGNVAPLDFEDYYRTYMLPLAIKVHHDDVRGVEPHHQEALRPQGCAVLCCGLAGELRRIEAQTDKDL